MDTPSESSLPVDKPRSPHSGSQPATPGTPINAPHRRSSLPFSQLLQATDTSCSEVTQRPSLQSPAPQTPCRPLSNIGRKRALVSPLARSGATPGHVSQMQRIFQDAKTSLQIDAAIASSPTGSIASRLPGIGAYRGSSHHHTTVGVKATDWRYSTVPQGLAEADLDVREPFPVLSPGLPGHDFLDSRQSWAPAREPMSSGFTSPVAAGGGDVVIKNDAPVPPLPTSSSSKSEQLTVSPLQSSGCGQVPARLVTSTGLEQPMTKMHVSHVGDWLTGVLQDSPNAQRQQRRRSKSAEARDSIAHNVDDVDMDDNNGPQQITLPTPAKAAAESAKLKRDLLGSRLRTSSNKENVRPDSRKASSALRCVTPTANLFSIPTGHIAPSPDFPPGSPSPSPLQSIQLPPAAPYRRVDATGSPFPILKAKLPHPVDTIAPPHQQHQQWQNYYYHSSPPQPLQPFASPPQQPQTSPPYHQRHQRQQYPIVDPSLRQFHTPAPPLPPPIPNSQQMISLHSPPPPPPPTQPATSRSPLTTATDPSAGPYYSFSTAFAAHSGSSAAPDSRIRDAYRTDTLTPFEAPTTRFRKIGLGARTQAGGQGQGQGLGVGRAAATARTRDAYAGGYNGNRNEARVGLARAMADAAGSSGARKYYAPARKAGGVGRKRRDEEEEEEEEGVVVAFRSSPPRVVESEGSRRKKIRRSVSGAGAGAGDGDGDGFSGPAMEDDRGGFRAVPGTDGELIVRRGADQDPDQEQVDMDEAEAEARDDGTSSITAVCGNGRTLVRRTMTTTQVAAMSTPNHDLAMSETKTPDQKTDQGGGAVEGEEDDEVLRELSPYVTPYRKGRGPKAEDGARGRGGEGPRRASYWDEDILPHGREGDVNVDDYGGEAMEMEIKE